MNTWKIQHEALGLDGRYPTVISKSDELNCGYLPQQFFKIFFEEITCKFRWRDVNGSKRNK